MKKNYCGCDSCGTPVETINSIVENHLEDIFHYCHHCTDSQGRLLPFERILENTTKFYIDTQDLNPVAAKTMAKQMLLEMPAWKRNI